MVTVTVIKVDSVDKATDRTVNLRMPTAMAANDLSRRSYASLAALPGWLITGNESFKLERAQVWRHIQSDGAEMDNLAQRWTSEQNKRDWSAAKPLLDELRSAQDKAEAIAHTPDEQPAAKILATEAAPLAKIILEKATAIIDHESTIASTDRRKSLLIGFADTRGSMAMAIGAIRGYLLTGNVSFKTEFEELWAKSQSKIEALTKRRDEMTAEQQVAFDALISARAKFAPLPQKMFEIRASDRWNMAQWFLTNEAAPRANRLLDIFAGAKDGAGVRSGGMVSRQQENLKRDGADTSAETRFLASLLWIMLGVAIGIAGDGDLPDQPFDRAADPEHGRRHGPACGWRSLRRDPCDGKEGRDRPDGARGARVQGEHDQGEGARRQGSRSRSRSAIARAKRVNELTAEIR